MFYQYNIKIVPAKPHSTIDYTNPELKEAFFTACEISNAGLAFTRDRKTVKITNIDKQEILVELSSPRELANPTRSLSSISRTLSSMPVYDKYLKNDLYNKVFYNPYLVESITNSTEDELSKEDSLKLLIDMFYSTDATESAQTKSLKEDTIKEITKLLVNYKKHTS